MKLIRILTLFLLLFTVLTGCSSGGSSSDQRVASPGAQEVFTGSGRGESLGVAIYNAKIDAIRKAVIDIAGPSAEEQNRRQLEETLYTTRNPNAYVYNETMETLRRENVGTIDQMDMVYEIQIRVNRPVIEQALRTSGVLGGGTGLASTSAEREQRAQDLVAEADPEEAAEPPGTVGSQRPAPPTTDSGGTGSGAGTAALAPQEGDWEGATEEEQRFIRRYVDTMTYMVYFNEESPADPFVMRSAVAQANSYLAGAGVVAIDAVQIEAVRRDQQLVYEQEVGREVGIIQWVAQRLNADVYIEIDAVTAGETQGGTHYGSANVTMRMFETSTGQLLGSVNRASPRTVSRASQQDAVLNALQSTVYQAMPTVIDQSRTQMARYFSRGIRYELVLQSTPDARLMSDFRRQMRRNVSDLITVSQSAEETVYEVYFFGRIDELEDQIYIVSDRVPGFEGLYLVLTRGKSLTFNTGL
jgi:hypothetical protein